MWIVERALRRPLSVVVMALLVLILWRSVLRHEQRCQPAGDGTFAAFLVDASHFVQAMRRVKG